MTKRNSSYNQILKSTSIFGGSQIISIIIGFAKSKIIALLLGPIGVGLIGNYNAIVDMIRSITGLGFETSGMREVAAVNSLQDKKMLIEVVSILKWWFIVTAFLGAATCIIFCYPLSLWAFDTGDFALPIALLSVAIFIATLTTGQTIVIQGVRKITYLVKANIYGNLFSLLVSIPVYFIWGLKGIALSLVFGNLASFFCSLFYYKKLNIKHIQIPSRIALKSGKRILKLGIFIVLGGISSTVSMFVIRSFISHNIDLQAAGLFQAVWAITNVYLMLILRSMGADYYPRLCSIINKNVATRKLVNEQTYIVLVVATPIIIGMILFSKVVLILLYSSDFIGATSLLQWQILGTFLKVLSWPMGFIILAKGKGPLFFISETLFYAVYLLSSYLLFPLFGLEAAGIGYAMAYIIYLFWMFAITNQLCRFRWKKDVIIMSLINLFLVCATFYVIQNFNSTIGYVIISVLLIVSLTTSIVQLNKVVDLKGLFNKLRKKK